MFDKLNATLIERVTDALAGDPGCVDDTARVEEIRALEELVCAAQARQAALAVGLTESRATAAEVALARRESPYRGRTHLGLARVVASEMPHLWAAWRAGRVSEWRVMLAARETGCLTRAHRQLIDAELAADPSRVEAMGDREVGDFCRARSTALDAAAVVARRRRAEAERRVTIRPAPDTMVHLTALLPVAQGVAAYAALSRMADTARTTGDARSRGQVMADTLVASVSGLDGDPQAGPTPAATINVVMTDRTLFGTAEDPVWVDGHGVVDAEVGRQLAHGDRVWLRRLFADPDTGVLVATETRARCFPPGLRRLVRLRDQHCRTPWCDAPVRHVDHVVPACEGGPTSLTNAQGLCEACNQAKQTTGWTARPRPAPGTGPGHTLVITTPAGQSHHSQAPPAPGFAASLDLAG